MQWSAVQDIRGGAGMRRGIADAVERDVTDSVVATPSGETFVPVITEVMFCDQTSRLNVLLCLRTHVGKH